MSGSNAHKLYTDNNLQKLEQHLKEVNQQAVKRGEFKPT
jgi:hypothetical protein